MEKCAECGNTFRSQLLWKSEVAYEDATDLTEMQHEELANQLDYAVMAICQDWGLFQ
jgi:hypothetical protein